MNAKYWLLGKHLSALTIAGGTRNSGDGTITYGTATSLSGSIDFIRANAQNLLDMIVSVDADRAHYEPTIIDSGVSVGEILKVGAAANILEAIAFNFTYAKVAFVRGGRAYAFEGVIDGWQGGVQALGKNADVLNLKQIALTATGGLTQPA